MPYDFGPQQAIAYLMDQYGMPAHIAAGIAGNIAAESGFDAGINEIDPLVEGSRGGFGLYQATGPRRVGMEAALKDEIGNPYRQMDYMMSEFMGPERKAYDRLMSSKNVDEAARVMSEKFLRPGIPHLEKRINYARQYAGLEPLASGPTRERAGLGLPLRTRSPDRPETDLGFYKDEYADNFLGRFGKKRDDFRAGLGDKLGMDAEGVNGLGRGLMAIGQMFGRT